jgi:pilus assembly protein CpaB
MRPIVIVLIVLAVGTGLIAVYLVQKYLASVTPAPVASTVQTGTQNVLVAARDIQPGNVLTVDDIRWEPWPEKLADERFIVQPPQVENQAPAQDPQQDFLDHIAKRSIMKGEPMSREMVIKQGDSGVTAANLAPGMRAITINVTPPQGVAGLILPNDRVDVVLSLSVRDVVGLEGWKDVVVRYSSETVMHDVRVVAINQKLSHDPKDGVGEPGNLVTLEVKPQDVEKLLVSQQLGTLSLTLRSKVANPDKKDPERDKLQTFTMDVRASKSISSLVALDLEEDEANLPETTAQAIDMAKERAKRRTEIKINRGGSVAVQKFGQ